MAAHNPYGAPRGQLLHPDPASGCRVVAPGRGSEGRLAQRAGRYELLMPIARGGMGAVWAARLKLDGGFEKLFAVKTLLPHLAGDSAFRTMFLDEARIAAGIEHPNVGRILDIGEDGDLLYFVMEWIEGDSLHGLIRAAAAKSERFPLGAALRIVADACMGLHAAHDHADLEGRALEIVHRDVSPHNVLVNTLGITKVIDFGVAQARGRYEDPTPGQIKGKVRFMAPEQACGRHLDRRADVWAVGAILYKLLTGRYPYPGETDVDFLRMMKSGCLPDPVPATVPAPLRRVLSRALAFSPGGRHASAADLALDIDEAARQLGVLTDTAAVAKCVGNLAGPRLSTQRAALRGALEVSESLSSRIWSEPPSLQNPATDSNPPLLSAGSELVVAESDEDATQVDARPPCTKRWRAPATVGAAVAAAVAVAAAISMATPPKSTRAPDSHSVQAPAPASTQAK